MARRIRLKRWCIRKKSLHILVKKLKLNIPDVTYLTNYIGDLQI